MRRASRVTISVMAVTLVLIAFGAAAADKTPAECYNVAASAESVPADLFARCNPHLASGFPAEILSPSDLAWGIENAADQFTNFVLNAPETLTYFGAGGSTGFVGACDFDNSGTFLEYFCYDNSQLFSVDTGTGARSNIAVSNFGGQDPSGLAMDPTSGIMYAGTTDVVTSRLYTVDLGSGVATLIGTITNSPGLIAMGFDPSGQLYGYDISNDSLIAIDKATAAGTIVGPLGFDANFGQGMDFDDSDGTCYLFAFNSTAFQPELRSCNTSTGSTTFLGVLGATVPGGLVQIGGAGIATGGGGASLVFTDSSFDDFCSTGFGDQNGIWEPGETIDIDVELTAFNDDFTGINGVLSSTTPGVVIVAGNASWGSLNDGNSATRTFTVYLEEGINCNSTVDYEVVVTANEGGPYNKSYSEMVGQPLTPNVPLAIPDGDPLGTTSDLIVAQNVTITDLDIRVQITHTFVGDLYLELRSPMGTVVQLLDRPGVPVSTFGCGDNDMDVTFDDESGTTAATLEDWCMATTPWYDGDAQAIGSLSAFDGESTAGTWSLFVSDNAGADTGEIVNWELITTPGIGGQCEICVGGGLGEADLDLSKVARNNGNGTATYTLTVTNDGPDDATGVVVIDPLPAGVAYISDDCGGNNVPPWTWNIGALADGASVSCDIDVDVLDLNDSTNTATVGGNESDPDGGNNGGTSSIPEGVPGIPTLGTAGIVLLVLLMAGLGLVALRRTW